MSEPRRFSNELRIRVNPAYDHEVEPEENPIQYWNPVSATNDLIKLANAALETAQRISDSMREKTSLTLQKRDLEASLDSFERELLVGEPPTASEAKSLKLINAAVARRANEKGQGDKLKSMQTQLSNVEREIERQQGIIDTGFMWLKANERMSDNLKSALSFYKDERRRSEYGA
jgi:hypothetical protein